MAKKEQAIMPVMPKKYETMWNFGQADDDQTGTLRGAAEAYNSGKDWTGITNGLQGNGNFVGYYDEAGAPTGAFYSLSGNANGSMLWGLGGNMANTGVDEGSLLQFSGDKSYWTVGPDGKLNPYQAAVADADAGMGGVPDYGTRGVTGNDAVPGSGGTKASYSESSSYSSGGNPYAAYLDAFDYGPAPEWGGTEYERRRDEALRRAENMQFNYDPNTDPSWLAYQKQYRREGQRATADALGQAAALTGGVPSSYAVTAASQAGDYYASQLSDKLPQLYQDAYNRYLQEYQRQLGIADAYAGYGQTEYNRYLDRLGQYNTDRNFAYGQYRDQIGDQRYADERDYERSENERQWAYQQALDEYNRQQDALANDWKERQWAQGQQEYADERRSRLLADAAKYYNQFGYIPEDILRELGISQDQALAAMQGTTSNTGPGTTPPPKTPPKTPPVGDGKVNRYNELVNAVMEGARNGEDMRELSNLAVLYRDNGWITEEQYLTLVNTYNNEFSAPTGPVDPVKAAFDNGQGSRVMTASIPSESVYDMALQVGQAVESGQMSKAEADDILARNGLLSYDEIFGHTERGNDLAAGYTGKKSRMFDAAAQALMDMYSAGHIETKDNGAGGFDINKRRVSQEAMIKKLMGYDLTKEEQEYFIKRFGLE